jgi:two-component system alkaline phosphatase synthesis response regulator PhoP
MPRVLVIEDDENLARGLEVSLAREGFDVVRARRGDLAVEMAARWAPDVITIDVMLPGGMDGFDVCRELRRRGIAAPVIMLTARSDEVDRVLGLELGADDYVTKPFSPRELVARIRARLRRDAGQAATGLGRHRFGDVEVDLAHFAVTRGGVPVELTAKEFEILRLLIRHRGEVVSRPVMLEQIWGDGAAASARTVDTHVMNLRRKLERNAGAPEFILSAYGEGYRFAG